MDDRNDAKDRINKARTSDVETERVGVDPHDITGNARRRAEDASPDDRARGERSCAEPASAEDR